MGSIDNAEHRIFNCVKYQSQTSDLIESIEVSERDWPVEHKHLAQRNHFKQFLNFCQSVLQSNDQMNNN
jgi:hypothetical protein